MELGIIEWTVQLRFLVALALGFLVGLERESIKVDQKLVFGGVRTHPIISLFGFGCAWLYQIGATAMLPVGLLAIAILTGIAYVAKIRVDRFGTTSEVSALLTFITGALAMLVDVWIAMALGVMNTMLLSEKAMLESYVERLSKVEFLATIKFILVTVIILPVLPNHEFTQFHLNPFKIWQIVIIVSTLGFTGYLLEKKFGAKLGLWMSGILGGIVSSTAVTLSLGRMARNNPARGNNALQATLLASSVTYLRMLVLIWFINGSFLPNLWYRLVILAGIGVILSLRMLHKEPSSSGSEIPELQNSGLIALSAIVGISDITPFILSLVQGSDGTLHILTSAIILAMMSNTIAKAIYFWSLSSITRKETALRYSIYALLHIPFIIW